MNATGEPLKVGLGTLTMAFGMLVTHLETRGIINEGEFSTIIQMHADEFPHGLATELKELVRLLTAREAPALTVIDGGRGGQEP